MEKEYIKDEIDQKAEYENFHRLGYIEGEKDAFWGATAIYFFVYGFIFILIFGVIVGPSWYNEPYIIRYVDKDGQEKSIYDCFRDDDDIKPYMYNRYNYNGSFVFSELDRDNCSCYCDKEKGFVFK